MWDREIKENQVNWYDSSMQGWVLWCRSPFYSILGRALKSSCQLFKRLATGLYCRILINSDRGVTCDTSIQNWPFGHSTSDLWCPKFFRQSSEWKLGSEQNGMDFCIRVPILVCLSHSLIYLIFLFSLYHI